jgi:hypothetical protein
LTRPSRPLLSASPPTRSIASFTRLASIENATLHPWTIIRQVSKSFERLISILRLLSAKTPWSMDLRGALLVHSVFWTISTCKQRWHEWPILSTLKQTHALAVQIRCGLTTLQLRIRKVTWSCSLGWTRYKLFYFTHNVWFLWTTKCIWT